ncbi:MAG TPA: hypothetical protein VK090_06640 [Paracoccaceae bacterium]|nr:hypothetical protein [Paracoccaceae bacterium]
MKAARPVIAALALTAVAACAKAPEHIAASYVPSSQYAGVSCTDLDTALTNNSERLAAATKAQSDARVRDQVAMGVGLVLFAPAVLLLAIPDSSDDLAKLKGEQAALHEAHTAKGCATGVRAVSDEEGAA